MALTVVMTPSGFWHLQRIEAVAYYGSCSTTPRDHRNGERNRRADPGQKYLALDTIAWE